MRRVVLLLSCLSVACVNGVDPAVMRDPSALSGRWTFQRAPNPSCAGDTGPWSFYVDLLPDWPAGAVLNVVDYWGSSLKDPAFVTGTIDLHSDSVRLSLWFEFGRVGDLLVGSIDDAFRFTGTMTAPMPGFRSRWAPDSMPCTWRVIGARAGA